MTANNNEIKQSTKNFERKIAYFSDLIDKEISKIKESANEDDTDIVELCENLDNAREQIIKELKKMFAETQGSYCIKNLSRIIKFCENSSCNSDIYLSYCLEDPSLKSIALVSVIGVSLFVAVAAPSAVFMLSLAIVIPLVLFTTVIMLTLFALVAYAETYKEKELEKGVDNLRSSASIEVNDKTGKKIRLFVPAPTEDALDDNKITHSSNHSLNR